MQNIAIVTEGNVQLLYDEEDVRKVCSIMRCGDISEDCIALLRKQAMKCGLCYSVLSLLGKPHRRI
jgi:hypothetical protein